MYVSPILKCKWTFLGLLVLLTPPFADVSARAADDEKPQRTVLGASGTENVQIKPDKVRIAIPLYAHTLTAAESLELIRQRKETAKERVLSLSCIPQSIHFGSVTVEDGSGELKLNSSSIRMLGAMGNDIDVDDLPELTTVQVDMTADWNLPAGADEEAVLGIVEQIISDLKQQDITGKDDRPEFSPKVEEAVKQLRMQTRSYISNSGQNNLDEIRYAFLANPTAESQQQAMQGAFADAKHQVDAIAQAIGLKLGQPIMVNSSNSLRNNYSAVTHSYNGRTRVDILQPRNDEVLAPLYNGLELSARVQVQFAVVK